MLVNFVIKKIFVLLFRNQALNTVKHRHECYIYLGDDAFKLFFQGIIRGKKAFLRIIENLLFKQQVLVYYTDIINHRNYINIYSLLFYDRYSPKQKEKKYGFRVNIYTCTFRNI